MLRYMLDTNLCIRVLRDRPEESRARFNSEADSLCISTIVLAELLHRAQKSAKPVENRHEVERFAARLDGSPFDVDAAAHAADKDSPRTARRPNWRVRCPHRRPRTKPWPRRRDRESRRVQSRRWPAQRGLACRRERCLIMRSRSLKRLTEHAGPAIMAWAIRWPPSKASWMVLPDSSKTFIARFPSDAA